MAARPIDRPGRKSPRVGRGFLGRELVEPAGEASSQGSWSETGEPLRLIEQSVEKDDPDRKAISCYGLYVPGFGKVWVRFVDGRPVSSITTRFLSWCCQKLQGGQEGLGFDLGQRFLARLQRGQKVDCLSQP
jgi:hypothetical protein